MVLVIVILLAIGAGLFILNRHTTIQGLIPLFCEDSEKKIDSRIEQANYCNADKDCAFVDFGCPFGCGSMSYINADIVSIKEQVSSYNERCGFCEYMCAREFNPVCKNNKCVETQAICQSEKVYEYPWECHCPKGTRHFVWLLEEKKRANLICRTILSCKGDSPYEKQALSYDYKIYSYENYVQVSGLISAFAGRSAKEKTIKLFATNRFYLPTEEGWATVELEKIEDEIAYFLYTYMAASPSCDKPGECYTCSFIKNQSQQ